VGWAALWLVPRGRAGAAHEPARAAVWLQRWVLFKLMFCSGAVKIQARGDASRRARADERVIRQAHVPMLLCDTSGLLESSATTRSRLAAADTAAVQHYNG
jgi:hypothetical protein